MRSVAPGLIGALGLAVSACDTAPSLKIYNQTPQVLVLPLYKPHRAERRSYEFQLLPGRHKTVLSGQIDQPVVLASGGCEYDYDGSAYLMGDMNHPLVIQVEPDFIIHLLGKKGVPDKVDVFRDDAARGFPITPKKTCQ